MLASFTTVGRSSAQFTEQEVRNGADVVATGDVTLNQSASGSQLVDINGTPIEGDGVYQTTTGQIVVNNGRVVATGDVSVNQSASGTQQVEVASLPHRYYDGMPSPGEYCEPGKVIADPKTGLLYFEADDCCYYLSACCTKSRKGCEGDFCGS